MKIRLRTEAGFGGVYFALAETFLTPSNNAGGNFRGMIDPRWQGKGTVRLRASLRGFKHGAMGSG